MNDFIKQRSFELSYALFQLVRIVKQKDLRARIEANAVYLLETAENGDSASLGKAIAVLKKLIILGEGIGEIGYEHSKVINRQFSNLNTAIAEYSAMRQSEEEKGSEVNLDDIFKNGIKFPDERLNSGNLNKSLRSSRLEDVSSVERARFGNSAIGGSSIRQSAIVDKIRQFGNDGGCRMKDVAAAFPEVSERTLRYDLQRVCEQGVVERIGNGGPLTFYRIKEGVPALMPREGVTN